MIPKPWGFETKTISGFKVEAARGVPVPCLEKAKPKKFQQQDQNLLKV